MSIFEYFPLFLAAAAIVLRFVTAERPPRQERPAEPARRPRRPRRQNVSGIAHTGILPGKLA